MHIMASFGESAVCSGVCGYARHADWAPCMHQDAHILAWVRFNSTRDVAEELLDHVSC